MRQAVARYVRAQAFLPTWAGVFVNPFFIARRGLAREMARLAPELRGRLLDVGCGTKPYASLFSADEYVGLDLDTDASRARGTADALYDGKAFPFEADAFESVVCTQVLEHVFAPDAFVEELRRVLKPGGSLLVTVPFAWAEHEQPFDYARYSSFGLKALLERHGLAVIEQRKTAANASTLFQLLNAYLYTVLPAAPSLRLAACVVLMAPISLAGLVLGKVLPGNSDLYLDQVVLARKA